MKSGIIRIASNYTRLLATLLMGLFVVPLVIGWLGDEAFGIISLLGASVGLAAVFRELTHKSMIRELGAAYHSNDPQAFLETYNSAYILSTAVAGLTLLAFGILLLIFPRLNISDELRKPAMIFLLAQASHAILIVLFSPAFNMYMVQHRFISYNSWYILLRGANFLAAVTLIKIFHLPGQPTSLATYGLLWAGLDNIFLILAVGLLMLGDKRLFIRKQHMHRKALSNILGTFGWNTGVQLSMASIERLPPFILNLMIGPIANTIWGVVYRLTSYVRMVTIGVQFGADSVSAKLSASNDEHATRRVRNYMSNQTRLNALVALPAGLIMFILARPLLDAWIGHKVEDPQAILAPAALMTRILAVAIVTRAVSEGWVTVLYGAGFVSRYAPVIFAGGILAPLLGILAIWVLPEHLKVQGPALGFAFVVSSVYLLALPVVGSKCVEQSYFHMLAPMKRPLLAATLAAPALFLSQIFHNPSPIYQLLIPTIAFGMVYGLLAFTIVLTSRERHRLFALIPMNPVKSPST